MTGHDLARELELDEERDYRLGEMPLPVRPAQPLIGAKRSGDEPGPPHSADFSTAAPSSKKVKMNEMEILISETTGEIESRRRWIDRKCMSTWKSENRFPRNETSGRKDMTGYRYFSRRRK